MKLEKWVNYSLFLILLFSILISGCVSQHAGENVTDQGVSADVQGLQIVVKDVGFPEVKYLQPTIKEVQLQDESGKWTTIWSSPEGKTVKLTPDGAEVMLDTVSVEAGTYIGTKLLVSTIDVEADINRDGDTLDKNQEIILTEEEFNSLPPQQKPSAPSETTALSKPTKPEQPPTPDKPEQPSEPMSGDTPKDTELGMDDMPEGGDNPIGEEPSEPSKPEEPSQPSEPEEPSQPSQGEEPSQPSEPEPCYKIVNGLVYMGGCEFGILDEKHTVTPPFLDGIAEHYSSEGYIFPIFETKFVYSGSGGKIIYDFTLHPLKPKHEQISVEVSSV